MQFLWNKWSSQLFLKVLISAFKIQRGTLQTQGCLFHFPFFCMALLYLQNSLYLWNNPLCSVRSSALLMLLYPGTDVCLDPCSWIWGMLVSWERETSCGVRIEAVLVGRIRRSCQDLCTGLWESVGCSCVGVKPFSNVLKFFIDILLFFSLIKYMLLFLFPLISVWFTINTLFLAVGSFPSLLPFPSLLSLECLVTENFGVAKILTTGRCWSQSLFYLLPNRNEET